MRGLEKNCIGRGQKNRHINTHTDFVTTIPTRPRGPSWWKHSKISKVWPNSAVIVSVGVGVCISIRIWSVTITLKGCLLVSFPCPLTILLQTILHQLNYLNFGLRLSSFQALLYQSIKQLKKNLKSSYLHLQCREHHLGRTYPSEPSGKGIKHGRKYFHY